MPSSSAAAIGLANFKTLSNGASCSPGAPFSHSARISCRLRDPSIEAAPMRTKASDSLQEIQRQHILRVLEETGWVISGPNGARAILDIHPNTFAV